MNIESLNNQPEVKNTFNIELLENEKIVFASTFPSSVFMKKGQPLSGTKNEIILTNKRLILCAREGHFSFDLKDDIQSCVEVKINLIFRKGYYYLVTLNAPVEYKDLVGRKYSTDAIRLEFNNTDRAKFIELIGIS